jgi:calcium-dependent protein kinase
MGNMCSKVSVETTKIKKNQSIEDLNYIPGVFVLENQQSFHEVYTLDSLPIGKGLYGEVRLCTHRRLNDRRAVKIIKKDNETQETIEKTWILREVEIFKSLDHPCVLRLYEFFESFDRYYLVMEYFEGGDLYSKITKMHKLAEDQVADIMQQVFSGVTYLHTKGIIHRDLKPENILLENKTEDDWSIKIIDFDTAVFLSLDSQIKGTIGSLYYMAPEVFDGFYCEKCDLWSCGVIMYILLSGNPPFSGLSSYQIVSRIRKGNYNLNDKIWSKISASAKDLITKLLEKDPKKRISAAEAFHHQWVQSNSHELREDTETEKFIHRLKEFNRTTKLKEAIQTFMLTQVMMSKELVKLEKSFKAIDSDGDGVISRVELLKHFRKNLEEAEAIEETDKIFANMSGNGHDCIEYIEFLRGAVESRIWLSKENLQRAFIIFDQDGNGKISKEEIVNMLSGGLEIDETVKAQFLQELFSENDQEMTMKDFQELLIEKLSSKKCIA